MHAHDVEGMTSKTHTEVGRRRVAVNIWVPIGIRRVQLMKTLKPSPQGLLELRGRLRVAVWKERDETTERRLLVVRACELFQCIEKLRVMSRTIDRRRPEKGNPFSRYSCLGREAGKRLRANELAKISSGCRGLSFLRAYMRCSGLYKKSDGLKFEKA